MEREGIIALIEVFGFEYTGLNQIITEMVDGVEKTIHYRRLVNGNYHVMKNNDYILFINYDTILFRSHDINELLLYIDTNLSHLRVGQPLQKLTTSSIIDY